VVVIFRVIRDVPGDVLLLDPADAVFETRRAGSRRYGKKPSLSVLNVISIGGSFVASGMSHGSEPFARNPSLSTITGTMYLAASRTAS